MNEINVHKPGAHTHIHSFREWLKAYGGGQPSPKTLSATTRVESKKDQAWPKKEEEENRKEMTNHIILIY